MAKNTAPAAASKAPVTEPSLGSIYFVRYKEATWIPIGREQEGVEAANSVTYSQGLRPPGHVTSFIKIESQASKGIADSAENATVFVVMRGEVTVVIKTRPSYSISSTLFRTQAQPLPLRPARDPTRC